MAIGLCNSIWSSHLSSTQRMSTFIILSRFLLYLHLYYNHITHLSHLSPTHAIMRSVSSSRNTVIHLSPSHHVITCTLQGYISCVSLTITPCTSHHTSIYSLGNYLFVCGNSANMIHHHTLSHPHLTPYHLSHSPSPSSPTSQDPNTIE